jgi:hypothetical protein
MFSIRKSLQCIRRPPRVAPLLQTGQKRSAWDWRKVSESRWIPRWKLPNPFDPVPEAELLPRKKDKRARPFNPDRPRPNTHREEEEDDFVATPMNGAIPVVAVAVIFWGFTEKWMRTLPVPNDGNFGPMRYANDPRAKYWGNYRYDIQPTPGRRHLDRAI